MDQPTLFIYGTLLDGDNNFSMLLKSNSEFLSPGKIKGRLYHLGNYPAAVADPCATGYVYGEVYRLVCPELILPVLDAYEGIHPDEPALNEYRRERCDIDLGGQMLKCWVYLLNTGEDGLSIIPSGRWIK
jgi:gamma-glutamylcyclotransferase (GGCT)/AIG2-like uncharacterized protein YtfP